ncbi:hypothetical protein HPGCJGGD_3126 [Methylobacterium haplocladii]|nr:hypothetical protein HPGCJGGD_3126 [Methylobacterium haplocladii]
MIWATRRVQDDEVQSIADLFRDQVEAFDPAGQMLLLSLNEAWPMVRLWVALPDEELLGPYYGFAVCPRAELPLAPTLIAGNVARFQRLFQDA